MRQTIQRRLHHWGLTALFVGLVMGCGSGVAAERTQARLDGIFDAIAAKPAWLRGPAYAKTLADAARRGTTNGAAYALCSEQAWAPTIALLEREIAGEVGAFDEGVVAVATCRGVKQLSAAFAVRSAADLGRQGHDEAAARRQKTACALGFEAACATPAKAAPKPMLWEKTPAPVAAAVRPQLLVRMVDAGLTVDGKKVALKALTKTVSVLADAALAQDSERPTPVVLAAPEGKSIGAVADVALALLQTGLPSIEVGVRGPSGDPGLISALSLVRSHRVKRPRTGPMAEATLGGVHLGMLEKEVVALYGPPENPAPSGPANFSPCETRAFARGGIAVDLCEGSSTPDRRVTRVETLAFVKPVVTNRGVGTKMPVAKIRAAYKAHRNPLNPRDYLSNVALQFVPDPETGEVTRVSLRSAY